MLSVSTVHNVQMDAILFYSITTLHNMLLHYEPAKMDVRLAGAGICTYMYTCYILCAQQLLCAL